MRIVLDLQACQANCRNHGIGRYSSALAKAMIRAGGSHDFWIVMNGSFRDSIDSLMREFDNLVPSERMVVFTPPGPTDESLKHNQWRARAASALYEYFLAGLNPDVVHLSVPIDSGYGDHVVVPFTSRPPPFRVAATLYDLIPLVYPDRYLERQSLDTYYRARVRSFESMDLVLSISESTKREALEYLGLEEDRVVNISGAISEDFGPAQLNNDQRRKILDKYGISKSYVMYAPSGFDWRKNLEGLFAAYADLPSDIRKRHQLVLVGNVSEERRAYLSGLLRRVGISEAECLFTGYVPERDLVRLYSLCELFVFPSLHEGFGLPVLEAMACGAPVIGANAASVPEIIGREDALFTADDELALAKAITRGLTDGQYRDELRQHGLERARTFSWERSAQLALNALEKLPEKTQNSGKDRYDRLLTELGKLTRSSEVQPTEEDLVRCALSAAPAPNQGPSNAQLLVDISELAVRDARSGIQRVVRSILLELLKHPPTGYTVRPVYFDGEFFRYAERYKAALLNVQAGERPQETIIEVFKEDIFLGLDLSANIIQQSKLELLKFRHIGAEVYFVVYDLLLLHHPTWWPADMGEWFQMWLRSIAEVATGFACISEAVATELRECIGEFSPLRLQPPKVGWFHLGADIASSAPTKGIPNDAPEILAKIAQNSSFLMVGTIEPRKGHAQVLSAFEMLWKEGKDVNLVIVGRQGWQVEKLVDRLKEHPERGKRLLWLQGISDEYLEKIYAASTCLIAASEGEGFGLPLIEAAQHGLPVIARDLPVFREVGGEHVYYFASEHPTLSGAIAEWLENHKEKAHPSSVGMPWRTWQESAQDLLKVLLT